MKIVMAKLLACAFLAVAPFQAVLAETSRDAGIEFPEESRALIAATQAFFETIEAETTLKQRAPVISVPFAITKSSASPTADSAGPLTRMGPVDHLTGYRITWYPVGPLYGTVDFMGTWDGNRNLVCGFLTWDLTDPDAPKLQTVSAQFVDVSALSRKSPHLIHQDLLEANCAHGAIDANYRVFDVTG